MNFENTQILMALTQKVLQDTAKSTEYVNLNMKTDWISPDSLRDFIIVTTLLYRVVLARKEKESWLFLRSQVSMRKK